MRYAILMEISYRAKPEDTLDLSRLLNDDLAKVVAENPRRFVGLGTLPMVFLFIFYI